MDDQITRMLMALQMYGKLNFRPAVEEPADDFERAVNDHNNLQAFIAEVKDLLKPHETEERTKRDALAVSLNSYFGSKLKEGVNTYTLSNGRKLKYTYKVDRKVDNAQVAVARAAFDESVDKPTDMVFDEMLRVKYELAAASYKKVTGEAAKLAVSRMLVTKAAASTLTVD